ncbi:unnamed protein product [Adineta steineri]|uniref:Uncharacterized protein n=1 Tax=Adineta steineri TaxID=433720 RepID=A0A815LCP8_9BILA|nr:unnamed protein product [Adineta steineri]
MLFYTFFILLQLNIIHSYCPTNSLCQLNDDSTILTCDTMLNDTSLLPEISCFPSVNTYIFYNFEQLPSHLFSNIKFLQNQFYTIKLINISIINSDTFSNSIQLPENSKLSIIIGDLNISSNIQIQSNTFNNINIDYLHFLNLNNTIFDTDCFGHNLNINTLIFEQCNLTSFSNHIRKLINVNHLLIKNSPELKQLTQENLPSFLPTLTSFELSNTALEIIQPHSFQAWSLILEEFVITNNTNLEIFPSDIVDGVLMKLNKLDLSYNPIKYLHSNYNWFPYSYTKNLLLKNQQLDLFLKSNILKTLPYLENIDLSRGFISENLMKNYFPNMSNLISIDVSYTNLTEKMIIDLLTHLSQTTNHFIDIYLRGHLLNDENFCSYFKIFQNAPNLLNLILDNSHECNCIIELFYRDKLQDINNNSLLMHPTCLLDSSRNRCDIQTQLTLSKCPTNSYTNSDDTIGDYAFGGVIAGVIVALLLLLSLGFGVVHKIRQRRNTDLTMEKPVENPLAAIIEERLQNV